MALIVNGETVEDWIIEREVESLQRHFEQMTPEQRQERGFDAAELEKHWWEWSRENVIERTLLRQEAQKNTEPIPPETVEKALDELKKRHGGDQPFRVSYPSDEEIRKEIETRIRLDRLIGKITSTAAKPKNKEIAEYYRKNRGQFKTPEMVHAAHMVKNVDEQTDEESALARIRKVEEELTRNGNFEALADEYSDCPGNGGDLGYFPRGQMVEEFEQVVFSMEAGEVSPVFRTVFGFHIAKVYDKKPASVKTLEEVREEVKQDIYRRKQTRALENYVDRLKATAEIRDLITEPGAKVGSKS